MNSKTQNIIPQQVIEDASEWAIMHGVAFRQADNTARHCPFSIAPMTMEREVYEHLRNVTPIITKLINNVSEDHDFLQHSLRDVAKAEPFLSAYYHYTTKLMATVLIDMPRHVSRYY